MRRSTTRWHHKTIITQKTTLSVPCSVLLSMASGAFRAGKSSTRRPPTSSSLPHVRTGGTTVAAGHACTGISGSTPTVRRKVNTMVCIKASARPISSSKTLTSSRLPSSASAMRSSTTSRPRTVCSVPGSISVSSTRSAMYL